MPKVKIKNNGNPVFIGKTICQRGAVTDIEEIELEKFCMTPAGSHVFQNDLEVIDGNIKKEKAIDDVATRAAIRVEVENEYEEKISELKKAHAAEIKKIKAEQTDGLGEKKEVDPDQTIFDQLKDFDPERHVIEHRGAGRWAIMDGEKKVYAIKDDEEKAAIEKLIQDSGE